MCPPPFHGIFSWNYRFQNYSTRSSCLLEIPHFLWFPISVEYSLPRVQHMEFCPFTFVVYPIFFLLLWKFEDTSHSLLMIVFVHILACIMCLSYDWLIHYACGIDGCLRDALLSSDMPNDVSVFYYVDSYWQIQTNCAEYIAVISSCNLLRGECHFSITWTVFRKFSFTFPCKLYIVSFFFYSSVFSMCIDKATNQSD